MCLASAPSPSPPSAPARAVCASCRRYWRLYELVQKFLVIAITIFCTFRGHALLGLMLVTSVHVLNFVILVVYSPFLSRLIHRLSVTLALILSADYIMASFIFTGLLRCPCPCPCP